MAGEETFVETVAPSRRLVGTGVVAAPLLFTSTVVSAVAVDSKSHPALAAEGRKGCLLMSACQATFPMTDCPPMQGFSVTSEGGILVHFPPLKASRSLNSLLFHAWCQAFLVEGQLLLPRGFPATG